MVQRYEFPAATQVGNAADPTNAQDLVTKNYSDNTASGFIVDTPPIYTNAQVASGNVNLTTAITAGQVSSFQVQTTGVAGTEISIQQLIDGKGNNQLWAFTGALNAPFLVASTVGNTGQVTVNLITATTFPAIPAGTVLQFQSGAATFTQVRDVVVGTNLIGTVAPNTQGRSTLTLSATGGGSGSVSINGNQVVNPNFVNNPAALGTNLTVLGSNISSSIRNSDVVAVADSEIALKIGSTEPILSFTDAAIPLIISFPSATQMILDVDSQAQAQTLLHKYLWRNSNGTNNSATDTIFVTAVQQEGVTQFQARITVTGSFTASNWTTALQVFYYTTNIPAGKFTFQPPPQAEIIRLASGLVGQATTAFNLGTIFNADNVGVSVRIISATPTVSNVAGVLNAVTDYGAITITSTPWPPAIPTGGNTAFLAIEASDFSWSGIGAIQTSPSNGLVQIAWVRPPAASLAGTSFTNARVWVLVDAISTVFVGSSVADATNSRPAATTLVYPDLTLGSITSGADSYGGSSTRVAIVPTINQQIATNIGQANSGTSGYVAGNVSSVTTGFGNQGTTWQVQTAQYAAAYAFMQTQGATPPAGNVAGNWTLPTYSLYLSNIATPTTSQFATITTITTNPVNSLLAITFSGNQSYFANAGSSSQALFISNNKFTFVPAPQAEVIRLSNVNNVSSLNTLKSDVTLLAGTGIGLSTSGQSITINSTSSGISASNFTTFVNDLGESLGAQGYVAFVGTGDQALWCGLGMDSDAALNDGGFIGSQKFVGTGSTSTSTFGYGAQFFVATTYSDLQVDIFVPAMTIVFTSQFSSGWDLEVYFAKASSTAASNPGLSANLFPAFDRSAPSDDASFNVLRSSSLVITPVAGQANTYSAVIGTGLYTAIANNYAHTDITNQYLPWVRLSGPAISSVVSVSITQSDTNVGNSGGFRATIAIPGVGGATPSMQQVATVGSTINNINLSLTGTSLLQSTAGIQLVGATSGNITLNAPATTTTYALTLPATQGAANTTLVNNGSGVLSWGSSVGTLTQVLTAGNSANNLNLTLTGTGVLSAPTVSIRNAANNTISLNVPASIGSNYTITLPSSAPAIGSTLIANDTSGGTVWAPAGLEFIRVVATSNTTITGPATIDGIAVATNDKVLAQNQTDTSQNGLYLANTAGAWVRVTTYVSQSLYVQAGTINAGRTYTRSANVGFEQWVLTSSALTLGSVSNGSFIWNNNGAFAGDSALIRDTVNNRASVAAPVIPANIARLADVQAAAVGIKPVDPQGVIVNISETNLAGTYTNNGGAGTATFTGTPPLTVAGLSPTFGQIVTMVGQTAGLQNGGYVVNQNGAAITITFQDPNATPNAAAMVNFIISNVIGGSANFSISYASGQTTASAISGTPVGLGTTWTYSSTNNSITLRSVNTTSRWTTTPVVNVSINPIVSWSGTPPTSNTVNSAFSFILIRVAPMPSTGEYWVSTATGATNYGVSYSLTTVAPITVGTTALTYGLFGVSNPVAPNLNSVLMAGNTSSVGLGITAPGVISSPTYTLRNNAGNTLMLNAPSTLVNYSLNMPGTQGAANTTLLNDGSGNLSWGASGGGGGNLTQTLTAGNTANNLNLILTGTGLLQSSAGIQLNGSASSTPAITLASAGASDVVNLNITTKGAGSAILLSSNSSDFLSITPFSTSNSQHVINASVRELRLQSSSTTGVVISSGTSTIALRPLLSGSANYNIIDSGTTELRIGTTASPGVVIGNLQSNGLINQSAVNLRSTSTSMRVIAQNIATTANINLSLEAQASGTIQLGMDGQPVSIGPSNTTNYNSPLLAGNATAPSGNLVGGTAGQVLTSRGNATPCWATPTPLISYRLTPFQIIADQTDTTVTFANVWVQNGTHGISNNSGVFTTTLGGLYKITVMTQWSNGTVGQRVTYIATGTTTTNRLGEMEYPTTTGTPVYVISGLWNSAANDTLRIWVWHNAGTNIAIGGGGAGLAAGFSTWVEFLKVG